MRSDVTSTTREAQVADAQARSTDAISGLPFSRRRDVLLASACSAAAAVAGPPLPAIAQQATPQFTQKVFLDIGLCPEAYRTNRAIGDKSALCSDARPLGRITIGLYGDSAPSTVANFVKLVQDGAYTGTTFHKVLPGKYLQAGKQGSKRYGRVDSNTVDVEPNGDLASSKAFALSHRRPGTVSLAIGENDDDDFVRERSQYNNAQFLITTGPGPAFDLDGSNLVFGQVVDGWDVLSSISSVPTIKPNELLERYNAIATFIGDDRAAKAKAKWGSPLQAVIIRDSGLL